MAQPPLDDLERDAELPQDVAGRVAQAVECEPVQAGGCDRGVVDAVAEVGRPNGTTGGVLQDELVRFVRTSAGEVLGQLVEEDLRHTDRPAAAPGLARPLDKVAFDLVDGGPNCKRSPEKVDRTDSQPKDFGLSQAERTQEHGDAVVGVDCVGQLHDVLGRGDRFLGVDELW